MFGENGLIKQAQKAKEMYEQSEKAEEDAMNELLGEFENIINGTGGGTTEPEENIDPETGWDLNKVDKIDDGKGNPVPLPKGFYYVGGDIDTGIVISDNAEDKNGGTSYEQASQLKGNQFVWIPVASEADLERTKFDDTGKPIPGLLADYTEPFAGGYPTEAEEYNTMKIQVLKYGGFYIGRFEAGVDSTTLRTGVTPAQKVVVKKGVAPYNWVPWGRMNDASEIEGKSGAVYLSKNFAVQEKYTSVTSTLCYGSQWDAMCRYIGDSQRTTPKKDNLELTGSVSTDVSKNIYDLAGNCFEYAMEACGTDFRTVRGGFYSYSNFYPVSYRLRTNPYDGYGSGNISFRPTLYVK